jgi:hypothetical protein
MRRELCSSGRCLFRNTSLFEKSQDGIGGTRRSEAVVDIRHGDSIGAAVDHAKQGRETRKACTVSDACGYRDHGDLDKPRDGTGKSSFHSRNNDHDPTGTHAFDFSKQTMDTRHTDIMNSLHASSERLERDGSLFSYG